MFIGFYPDSFPAPAPAMIVGRIQKINLISRFCQFDRIMMFGQLHFAPGLRCEYQNDFIGKTGWNRQYILSFLLSVQDTWEAKEFHPAVL